MNEAISAPKDLSENAPAMKTFMVDKDKIKEIIGKGGAVIKSMQEKLEQQLILMMTELFQSLVKINLQ